MRNIKDEKVEALRKERNELQKRVGEIQQQIDARILELQNVADFSGKCIYYKEGEFGCEIYMLVKSFSRTFDGVMFDGYIVNIYDGSAEILRDHHYTIDYNNLSDVVEITKEYFKETISQEISNIIEGI